MLFSNEVFFSFSLFLTFLGLAFALLSRLSPRVQEVFYLLLMLVAGYNNMWAKLRVIALWCFQYASLTCNLLHELEIVRSVRLYLVY